MHPETFVTHQKGNEVSKRQKKMRRNSVSEGGGWDTIVPQSLTVENDDPRKKQINLQARVVISVWAWGRGWKNHKRGGKQFGRDSDPIVTMRRRAAGTAQDWRSSGRGRSPGGKHRNVYNLLCERKENNKRKR